MNSRWRSLAAAVIALAGMAGMVAVLLLSTRAGSISAFGFSYLAAAVLGITAIAFAAHRFRK